MKHRSFLHAVILIFIAVALCAGRAQAVAEFCPATLLGFHAITDPGTGNASRTYGYKIGALGKRTVNGLIAIETDKGWFTAPFAKLSFYSETRSFAPGRLSFDLTMFTAPTQFVTFPQNVIVRSMWVTQASATGDGAFGWQARGSTPCDPPVSVVPTGFEGVWSEPDSIEHPPTTFVSPFAKPSVAAVATPVDAPVGLGCEHPFVGASIVAPAKGVWPDTIGPAYKGDASLLYYAVALDARGRVTDVSPWGGVPEDDRDVADVLAYAEVAAARKTTYAPAIALCRPVPSIYFFRYDWLQK